VAKRKIPYQRRALKPRTCTIYCRMCDMNEQDCNDARACHATIPHVFDRVVLTHDGKEIEPPTNESLRAVFAPLNGLRKTSPAVFAEFIDIYEDLFGSGILIAS